MAKTDPDYVRTVSAIVSALIAAVDNGEKVKLRQLIQEKCGVYKCKRTPKQVDILAAIPERHRARLLPLVMTKPVRSISGVSVIAVMCKPHVCPHVHHTGNVCLYCPGGPDSDFEYSTQSYTGFEPTSMRAIRARYHPLVQSRTRLTQLRALGHPADKVEYIIMGGTFMSLDVEYRDWFIANLHDALSGHTSDTIEEAVAYAEHAKTKNVGITIETRPDFCLRPHIDSMLTYGCTRIEIGVQSIYEDVARDTNRGHTVADVADCFTLTKDAGFKIVAHLMPDLPNMSMERDLASFTEFFENPAFRADGLKIYPLLIIRGTGTYELWRRGLYRGYPPDVLVDLLARMLVLIPPYVRVYRIQRDIPMPLVTSGVGYGHLREVVLARMREVYGTSCRDVRTREVGIQSIHNDIREDQVELVRRDYTANGGWETFLSYEDTTQDVLVGMIRLRKCTDASQGIDAWGAVDPNADKDALGRVELLGGVSVVRELHVYGSAVPIDARDVKAQQHKGYGAELLAEAERIARDEHGSYKIAIIAGIGVRKYYEKFGYYLDGPYMSKDLDDPPEGLEQLVAKRLEPTRAKLRKR